MEAQPYGLIEAWRGKLTRKNDDAKKLEEVTLATFCLQADGTCAHSNQLQRRALGRPEVGRDALHPLPKLAPRRLGRDIRLCFLMEMRRVNRSRVMDQRRRLPTWTPSATQPETVLETLSVSVAQSGCPTKWKTGKSRTCSTGLPNGRRATCHWKRAHRSPEAGGTSEGTRVSLGAVC